MGLVGLLLSWRTSGTCRGSRQQDTGRPGSLLCVDGGPSSAAPVPPEAARVEACRLTFDCLRAWPALQRLDTAGDPSGVKSRSLLEEVGRLHSVPEGMPFCILATLRHFPEPWLLDVVSRGPVLMTWLAHERD